MSFIIPVANLKGGVSKTTTAMLVAAQFEQSLPDQVVVVDSDPQGSASLWAGKSRFPVPVVAAPRDASELPALFAALAARYTAIIVDCPPSADSPVTQAAIAHADLLVVPCPPAVLDLEATTMLLAAVQTRRPTLRALVVPVQVPTTMTDVAKFALAKMKADWPLAKSALYMRTAYREAAALGTTLRAAKGRGAVQAQQEVAQLTQEILFTLIGA